MAKGRKIQHNTIMGNARSAARIASALVFLMALHACSAEEEKAEEAAPRDWVVTLQRDGAACKLTLEVETPLGTETLEGTFSIHGVTWG